MDSVSVYRKVSSGSCGSVDYYREQPFITKLRKKKSLLFLLKSSLPSPVTLNFSDLSGSALLFLFFFFYYIPVPG